MDLDKLRSETKWATVSNCGILLSGKDAERCGAALDEYLQAFAAPSEDFRCLACGSRMGGILGSFRWGLAHGEGFCAVCDWPARVYHMPEVDGSPIFAGGLQLILQYHPDNVRVEKGVESDEDQDEEDE